MITHGMRTRGQGAGPVHRFVCARCALARPVLGRKRLRWRGLPAWLCAACADALARDRAGPGVTP